jgi:hypothetical protein
VPRIPAAESAIDTTTTASGFDWIAAGMGALVVAAAGVLALTTVAVVRRQPAGLRS